MKRRDIIAAGVAGISAATVTSVAAQKADKENPELAKIKVHDDPGAGAQVLESD